MLHKIYHHPTSVVIFFILVTAWFLSALYDQAPVVAKNGESQIFLPTILNSNFENPNENINAEAARSQILAGVTELASPDGPGKMIVYGANAYSIANYQNGSLGDPMIAAGQMGLGKVIALPDHSWLEMDSYGDIGTTGPFYLNSIAWLTGTTSKTIKIVITPNSSAASWLSAQGFTNVVQSSDYATDLQGANVLIGWLGPDLSENEINIIADYVRHGGGLFLTEFGIGYSWWWNKALPEVPSNILLREVGIGFTGDWPHDSADINPINRAVGQLTSDDVINMLNNTGGYSAQQWKDGSMILKGMFQVLPVGDPLLNQLDQLYQQRINQINPTQNNPITETFEQALLYHEGIELQNAEVTQIGAHRLAGTLYGEVPSNAPRVNQTVTIDSNKSRWQPTGLFIAPGEVATVIVPEALVGQNYSIRINAHTDDISERESWERPPLVHRSFTINNSSTPIASAFGGLLFIDLGDSPPNLGDLNISVQNAIEAPYFVLGTHSDEEWLTTLRYRPAPFANLVSDNLMISLPSSYLANLEEPTALMSWWNEVVRLEDDLAAQSRTSPELMNIDVQISAGSAHSGYPYQGYAIHWGNPADWNNLSVNGSWGDFHELGHNHQRDWWTFYDDGEVTVNIFSNYVMESLTPNSNDGWAWSNDPMLVIQEAKRNVEAGGSYSSKSDRWSFWFQLADGFGWEAYQQLFQAYENDNVNNPAALPTSEEEKKDQLLVRFSQQVGYNMTRFMRDTWGLEVSQGAVDQISHLPDWMPVIGGIQSATVTQNSSYIFELAGTAESMDGVADLLNVTEPANGLLVNNGDGTYTYTPNADYVGEDAFVYTLQSSVGNTQDFTVNLTISAD